MKLPEYKRKALRERGGILIRQYEAVSGQLNLTVDEGVRVKLEEQLKHLEQEIDRVRSELGEEIEDEDKGEKDVKSLVWGDVGPGEEPLYGQGRRWAVLAGVNYYEDKVNYGALRYCVNDVTAMRDRLAAGGFDADRIRLLTDEAGELPSRENILSALKSVADATERDDLLLFHYSGHGHAVSGESYLVARNGRHIVLPDTGVPVTRVKEIMQAAPTRAKVIVLDACHSGADIGGKGPQPMTPEFIQRVFEQAAGLAILASCTQGQLSREWPDKERGVFTHYLLEALEGQADCDDKGFVTVQDANLYVVDQVKLWASQRNVSQTPTLHYEVAGDIILTRYK